MWDVEGRRYLDLGSGIAVTNTGHRHPHVVDGDPRARSSALLHTSVVLKHQPYIEACEAIAGLAPFLDHPKVFLCNSGAEAVDGAIKLARRTTGRPGIVAFRRAFHGRTMGATSLTTAKAAYQEGYGPLLPDVHVAPYCIPTRDAGDARSAALDRLARAPTAPPGTVAAMIVEPVLGEGGYIVPPVEWLAGLRQRCDDHGILLVFDEVQSGFGRTGRPFAAETFGVAPDVRALRQGRGLGAAAGRDHGRRRRSWTAGRTAPTARPSAATRCPARPRSPPSRCSSARASTTGPSPSVTGRAPTSAALGSPAVVEVRGVGAMIGVELTDKATAEAVQQRCLDDGVLVLTCGPDGNVLRLIPPLTMTDDELDHGLDVLADGALALVRERSTDASGRRRRLLLDLAGAALGELVEDDDGLRRLEGGEALADPGDELGLVDRRRRRRGDTNARGTSPQRSSGTPTTAASRTAGCGSSACSTSTDAMFSPPDTMRSLARSTMVR